MRLATIASRLAKLRARSVSEAGLLTYPIGAVICAAEAQRCGFADRIDHPDRWKVEVAEALQTAKDVGAGRRPAASTWLSVVHFNSALHRIDVGYERIVKHLTGTKSCRFKDLAAHAASARVPSSTITLWEKVRSHEVNRLKHQAGGGLTGQRITFQETLRALDALVRLLEARL